MDPDGVRFRAECQTCPYQTNPDWGNREPTSFFEHSDEDAVTRWATNHANGVYAHMIKVSCVIRIPINVEYLNKTVLDMIMGTTDK